jgi:hypothetical protein
MIVVIGMNPDRDAPDHRTAVMKIGQRSKVTGEDTGKDLLKQRKVEMVFALQNNQY